MLISLLNWRVTIQFLHLVAPKTMWRDVGPISWGFLPTWSAIPKYQGNIELQNIEMSGYHPQPLLLLYYVIHDNKIIFIFIVISLSLTWNSEMKCDHLRDHNQPSIPPKNTFAGLKRPIADEYDQVVLSLKDKPHTDIPWTMLSVYQCSWNLVFIIPFMFKINQIHVHTNVPALIWEFF